MEGANRRSQLQFLPSISGLNSPSTYPKAPQQSTPVKKSIEPPTTGCKQRKFHNKIYTYPPTSWRCFCFIIS